jgi:TPR repeat protein
VAPYELLKIMADSGSPSFQIQFASKLLSGIDMKYDVARAYRYLLMAEAQEELEAKVPIGEMLLDGMAPEGMPTHEQHQRTFSLLREAIERTAAEPANPCRLRALFRMGQCPERGWACFHNEKEALKRFKEAAARSHPESEARYAFSLDRPRQSTSLCACRRKASQHRLHVGIRRLARGLR